MSGVSSPVYGSGGGGSGSSLPSSVDYAFIVAKNKVGLDAAITGPTSFGIRFVMPSDTDYPVDVVGGLSLTDDDTLSFTDGTNTATLTTALPAAGTDVIIGIDFSSDGMRIGRVA